MSNLSSGLGVRIKAGMKSRFRHYLNLHKTEDKLRHLLQQLPVGTMKDTLNNNSRSVEIASAHAY